MGKRKRNPSNKLSKKVVELIKNPVIVGEEEFDAVSTFEEVNSFKFMGTSKTTGKPFMQDWTKDGPKTKVSQPRVIKHFQNVSVPKKPRLSGREALSNNGTEQQVESSKQKPTKKKKQAKQKASYDKTDDQLQSIANNKDNFSNNKDSGIDEDEASSPMQGRKPPEHPPKCDVSAWDELGVPESIKKALAEQGFSKPTKIQELTIPAALTSRCDVLGAAETGSGKTLAFGIPIIAGILNDRQRLLKARQGRERVVEMRDRTCESKRARDLVKVGSDEEESDQETQQSNEGNADSDEEQNSNDDDEWVETDDSDVEEYLFNGEDGIVDANYDEINKADKDSIEIDASENDNDDTDDHDEDNDSDDMDVSNNESDKDEGSDDNTLGSDEDEDSDDDDLGSDDEDNFQEDAELPEEKTKGCVFSLNNVEFPFIKKKIQDEDAPLLRALILTPTRELAIQIHGHLSRISKHTDVKSCVVVGGLDARKQKRLLKRSRPEIVVATPGRLWELIQDKVEHLTDLSGVRYLAIDEADRMIDRKNFEEVHKLVRLINGGGLKCRPGTDRQTFIFSATLSMVHQLPDRLKVKQRQGAGDPTSESKLLKLSKMVGCKPSAKTFDVTRKHATAKNLTECRINCDHSEKDHYLFYFLKRHPGRTMVFCNSIEATRRLHSVFTMLGCSPQDLHASMHQKQRLRNLTKFTSNAQSLLITTDVSARGLDITGVQHVIHYQVPFTAESYVHRSGRTARGTHSGLSVVFVEPKEVIRFRQICYTLARENVNDIPLFPVDENIYEQVYERVTLAVKVEKLQHQEKRDKQLRDERIKVSDDIGVLPSDEELDQEDLKLMSSAAQRLHRTGGKSGQLKRMKDQLQYLLQKPFIGAIFSYSHPHSRAALAAAIGTDSASIPNELVGLNPTRSIFGGEEDRYRDRYAMEMYGEEEQKEQKEGDEGEEKVDVVSLLKKQKKDMAKLTKKLLRPEISQNLKDKKLAERRVVKKEKKALKKREKRRKKNKGL